MKLPCEIAVKSVIPSIRALLAMEFTKTYGMTQREAASLLGITQTAISKYAHHERGRILQIAKDEEVERLIMETASSVANGSLNKIELLVRICALCRSIRKKGLMCESCKRADPTLEVDQCKVCFATV